MLLSAMQRAMLSGKQGRHADALADWQLAIDRAPPGMRRSFEMEAALSLARSGDHAAAAARAEEILKVQAAEGQNGLLAYSAARVLAQASRAAMLDGDLDKPMAEQERETCLAKAIDYLQRAQRAGYFDEAEAREGLLSEPDLDPLRQHDDFRKLLDEIGLDPDAEPQTVPAKVQPRVARDVKRTGCIV